ncbi:MAG: PulJ/GspJ family protein [Vulcanimicrobiaceae bacterium]
MRDSRERGSTLFDVLLASAIGAMIAIVCIGLLRVGLNGVARTNGTARAFTQARTVIDRLHARADSAWSVFVPTNDVFGRANNDGHEVDLSTETANHVPFFWAETYDASARTLTGYTYAMPGDPPTLHDEPIADVRDFTARSSRLEDLALATSPVFDPLFARATLHDADVALTTQPGVRGGNGFVSLHFTIGKVDQETTLAAATAPTGFTVVVPY